MQSMLCNVSVNYILFNKNTYKTLHSDIHRKGLENKCKTLIQIPLPFIRTYLHFMTNVLPIVPFKNAC